MVFQNQQMEHESAKPGLQWCVCLSARARCIFILFELENGLIKLIFSHLFCLWALLPPVKGSTWTWQTQSRALVPLWGVLGSPHSWKAKTPNLPRLWICDPADCHGHGTGLGFIHLATLLIICYSIELSEGKEMLSAPFNLLLFFSFISLKLKSIRLLFIYFFIFI